MVMDINDWKTSLCDLGQFLHRQGLSWGSSGNLSARVDDRQLLMTASGTHMGSLVESDIVSVDRVTGQWTGERKPSKEVPMHAAVYNRRADARVVIHASPFWSTLVACSNEAVISELFIESMYYVEKVAYVDYYHPGSQALGDAVYEKAAEADVLLLRNHGILVYDESIKEASMRLETLEMTCRMMITAKSAGVQLQPLDQAIAADFLHHGAYKPTKRREIRT